MTNPLFRIEQLISALLKGSPDDPVYLKVGPTTYGIKSITDGQIRVTTGKQTQDAAQVVKTLRRYATGTPKGEDTGIAWRIVGVGGGTAIKSVSHDGSRIVVTTLANEGKDAETFEAPKSERRTTPSKRAHNSAVSSKISQIMRDYDKTGRIGSSKPKNRAAAIKQAVAVAYSMVNKDYSKSGKRLPTGVRRAESEDDDDSAWSELMVIYGDYADSMEGVKGAGIYQRAWYVPDPDDEDGCFVCQGFTDPMCMVVYALTDDADAVMDGKAEPSEEGEYYLCDLHAPEPFKDSMNAETFGAPMGYAPDGPKPFYGNPRKLVRDRWGNLRFIRRRKDGTYMDNVDFGRSIRADRQRQAKTWAPGGFRDQGDGSLDLLTSLMGAEDWGEKMTLEQRAKALSEMTWEQVDGRTGYGDDLFAWHEKWDSKTPSEREAYALKELTAAYGAEDDVFEASRRSGSDAGEGICGGCGKNSEHRMNFGRRKMCYDCAMERYGAESGDTGKWFIIPMQELLWDGADSEYWNAGTPCAMDPDDFLDDAAEEIYDLDEVFFNVPWPQVYDPGCPVVNLDTGEAFLLDKKEQEYDNPIIAILIRVKDQEVIDKLVKDGNRAFDRPPTFDVDYNDPDANDFTDIVIIDGQRHAIMWHTHPDHERMREEVFARTGLGPGGYEYPVVWLVNSAMDGVWEEALLFRDESDARAAFEESIVDLGGDPADASYGDWSGDDGFRRAVMYQVTIQ